MVLLVTHNVLEAERAVDRLAIIDKGKVVSMGTLLRSKATAALICDGTHIGTKSYNTKYTGIYTKYDGYGTAFNRKVA